jgi:hypothetical protein
VFNEISILQLLAFLTLAFFINTYNILTLWLLGGFYLIILGVWLLLDDGDIFIGFLWVIDLGVGLIFFIFILHYSTFLYQKAKIDKSSREISLLVLVFFFLLSFFYFFVNPVGVIYSTGFRKTWFFFVSWYDYYDLFYSYVVTDLNLLREIYFYNNSFEFFLINFLLFYGIIGAILLTFLIKRIFSFTNYDQLMYWHTLRNLNSIYFIRNQNYLKQSMTSTGTRVWLKKKHLNL